MLQRSKSERFSGHSCASPRSLDLEGHFRSISHPNKDFESTHESIKDTRQPVFESFMQQKSPNGYLKSEGLKSIKDRRTLNSSKSEIISVDLPPVRGRNTLFSINQSKSGVAQLDIPSFKLASSRSLSSLKNENYFHSPEVIKPIPSLHYTENIGIALGSPTHCDDIEMKIPLVSNGNGCSYVNDSYLQPPSKDLKSKASRWKMFEGLFGAKRKETTPVSAYHKYHGRPRPTLDSKSNNRASTARKNNYGDNTLRKSVTQTTKISKRLALKSTNSSRYNSSSSRVDGQILKKSGVGNYDSLIDVEIPFTKMDRYSVILNEVQQNPPPIGRPPLYRRQTGSEKFKSVNGDSNTIEQDIHEFPKHMRKPSLISQRKLASCPSFRDKPASRTGSPSPKIATHHRIPSRKPSTCLSIPKNYSIDRRRNQKENQNEKNGSLESKISNKHLKSHSDTTRTGHKTFSPPPVPKKETQNPVLSFPKDSFLDFGFSKLFIKDGYQDFFTSSSSKKQFDSPGLRPQCTNNSDVSSSLSSISSSERSFSGSTYSSSIASPLGTTPLTGHFDEMRFPTPPIGTAVYTSFTPPSISVPTHRTNSPISNYSTKKSSMHSSKTNLLKKSSSFSEKLGRTKSYLKLPSHSQTREPEPHQAPKLTPFPRVTASSPAKIATNAVSSPLGAFTIATNEEMERVTDKLSREGNPKQRLGPEVHTKKYRSKEQVLHGPQSRNPNFGMVDTEQEKTRHHSKSLDLTRKNNENHTRGAGSTCNIPTWNSNNSPVVGLIAVNVARGIVAREYRKSHKAVVERMSVVGNI
ncbi:hypothetical protein OnM2_032001 [Erysiphe neolycopersici]|uniref:Uncharacterized protein n=1 Tax=Erysiphe neolycopersici TaxID=212602 RepID=A0A420HYX1_9PEZI|nr:hypothetical protein OnM2_032001 [Erysiphe neolycopersici]